MPTHSDFNCIPLLSLLWKLGLHSVDEYLEELCFRRAWYEDEMASAWYEQSVREYETSRDS